MTDLKISELPTILSEEIEAGDWLPVVDSSTNTTKKVSAHGRLNTPFSTVTAFADAVTAGYTAPDDTVVYANGVPFIADSNAGSLAHPNIPGWRVLGTPAPQHFGSFGKLKANNPATPYLLSDVYSTLAAAQAVYPKAIALTQTVDDMACQAMVDYLRANFFQAKGGEEIDRNTGNNIGQQTAFLWPRGTYYLTRPLDATGIRFGHTFWEMRGEGATIMGCTPGKPIIDLTGSRKCVFTGNAVIVGVWTSAGISRSAIQVGRPLSGLSSDSHNHEGGWEIKGRFSLAGLHNYASEDFRFGALAIKNDLDPRVYHCSFDGSDGSLTFATGEAVTWGSGASTGVAKVITNGTSSGEIAIRLVSGSAPVDNDIIVGGTSTKTATINGAPVQEPDGEGPGGLSYCMVQDGDNYWGLQSDYQSDPLPNTAASFLRNVGTVDLRHTGKGNALWICLASNHDYRNSYLVSEDAAGGAAVVAFANTVGKVLDGCLFDVHIETDLGDLDADTGLDFGFLIDSATPGRAITVNNHMLRTNTVHPSAAVYFAASSVSSVAFTMSEIEIEVITRDVGQQLFRPAEKFSFHGGKITCGSNGSGPFLNLRNLADIGGCEVICPDISSVHVRHATGKYLLMDLTGGMTLLNGLDESLHIKATAGEDSTILRAVSSADGSVLGQMNYNDTFKVWSLAVDGSNSDYAFANTAFYPLMGSAVNLGLVSNPWLSVNAVAVRSTTYRDVNNVKLLGTQSAAVQEVTVTATTGTLPTANGSLTIADAAAPTNAELLEYCRELEATLETLLSRVRVHGLIAT